MKIIILILKIVTCFLIAFFSFWLMLAYGSSHNVPNDTYFSLSFTILILVTVLLLLFRTKRKNNEESEDLDSEDSLDS